MKKRLVLAAVFVAALLPACGGKGYAPPASPAFAPAARAAHPTPFPLPKKTPDWTIVEKPVPWDYSSTGPDRTACTASDGLTYRVGPGQAYPEPHDVPWLRLLPCDTVLIYWRSQPYTDAIYIATRGALHKAITIEGVLSKTGQRPLFDGSHAVQYASQGMDPYEICLGMISVGLPSSKAVPQQVYGYKPGYLIIENFEVRNAFGKYPGSKQPVYTCTVSGQPTKPWQEFVSGIYINPAEHLLLANNYLHNNGLGAFTNSLNGTYGQSRDFVVRDNTIIDNGNGEASQHNYYFELVGERVIRNYFGPPIAHTQGENIKDRSVCVEYSDNYIDSGNNLIAFRDPQSNGAFEWKQVDAFGAPCVSQLYVHGNTFVSRGPTEFQAMSVINGFGDGKVEGAPQNNRYGSVYFYGNVVVAIANKNPYGLKSVPVFQNANQLKPTTFYALNNLFYSAPQSKGGQAPPFAACYWQQYVNFTSDWASLKIQTKYATATDGNSAVGTPCDGSGMTGITVSKANPGFVNFAHGDLHLVSSSPFYGLTAPLPPEVIQRHLQPDNGAYPTPNP
jgi:hypothetical protein